MPTIKYTLITRKDKFPTDESQTWPFDYITKGKIQGKINIKLKYITKYDIKIAIAEKVNLPIETIDEIYSGYNYMSYNYTYLSDEKIKNVSGKTYYAYIDLDKDPKKVLEKQYDDLNRKYNNLQSDYDWRIKSLNRENDDLRRDMNDQRYQMNEKNQQLEKNIQSLEQQNQNIKDQCNYLNNENISLKQRMDEEKNQMNLKNQQLENNIQSLEQQNQNNKNQLNNLTYQHNNLIKKQNEEEQLKKAEKANFENYKYTFQKDKEIIENNNLMQSKNYICNYIINTYVKDFENKNNNNNITQYLNEFMSKFTNELMTYCKLFNESFQKHSQKIVKEYKVNESKIIIQHINFIVMGKIGIGKSTFINECLLLSKNQMAEEGIGLSMTKKSTLYCSEKLKMIRMWDTQGLDETNDRVHVLDEIRRLVNEGLAKGPDHYINIILYCIEGKRFQESDGKMIKEIMQIYPMDNLPVIITQLQTYFQDDANRMQKAIQEILQNFLEEKIVEKIEIKSVVARDKKEGNITIKSRGIPEILTNSFDVMGRAITSATYKKLSQDIENLCQNFVDAKIYYLKQKFKDELEVLEIAKDYYIDNSEKYFVEENKPKRVLSKLNFYNKMKEKNYFFNYFVQSMAYKFIDIYNNLNGTNYSIEKKPEFFAKFINQLENIKKKLNDGATLMFEKQIYKELYQNYSSDLRKQQSILSKQFNTTKQVIDEGEIDNNFKKELLDFFRNEFFKYFFCIIIKLFMQNLENNLINNYQKELKENKEIVSIIDEKAKKSLKDVTKQLKENLLEDLKKYFKQSENEETINNNNDEINNYFNFDN